MSSTLAALAQTPVPPYYAVIFTSLRTEGDRGYGAMAQKMIELAARQPGFLGVESACDANGLGITVSYWANEEAIAAWKANVQHQVAQKTGKTFGTQITKFELRKWNGITAKPHFDFVL